MAFASHDGPDFAFELIPADKGPLPEILTAWHRKAVAAGRVPCVYLTAAWCPPSVILEKSLTDPRMQQVFSGVDAATFNIDDWADKLSAAGFAAHSVPIFFILGADGRPTGQPITGAAWGANTVDNMAPPLGRFFDAARAARPQRLTPAASPPAGSAYAPPIAPEPAKSKLPGVLMLVAAVALLVVGAWLKVSSDEADNREKFEREQKERIQSDVQKAIRSSLQKQAETK